MTSGAHRSQERCKMIEDPPLPGTEAKAWSRRMWREIVFFLQSLTSKDRTGIV